MDRDDEWWRTFYDESFADAVLMNDDGAPETAAAIARVLELRAGDRILDQCCGTGRLSQPLAALGLRVVGVDAIAPYVERARARVPTGQFIVGDASEYVADPCDAVINWHTSFGHAQLDSRNLRMLEAAHASLRRGGRFALEYANVPRVLRDFQRAIVQRAGDTIVLRESSIDLARGTLEQAWTYVAPDGRRHTTRGSTRLYMPHELARLMRDAGFTQIQLVADLAGAPLTIDAARCICLGVRP